MLTQSIKPIKLQATKKPLAMNGFDVSVDVLFWRQRTDERIISFLIDQFQAISKSLSTAARIAVEIMGSIVPDFIRKQSSGRILCYSSLTGAENSKKTAEGELAANQDDERRWIIVRQYWIWMCNKMTTVKDRGVPTVIRLAMIDFIPQ